MTRREREGDFVVVTKVTPLPILQERVCPCPSSTTVAESSWWHVLMCPVEEEKEEKKKKCGFRTILLYLIFSMTDEKINISQFSSFFNKLFLVQLILQFLSNLRRRSGGGRRRI